MLIVGKLAVIASLVALISVQPGCPQQCSADRLPDFGDAVPRTSPERDRFQAIVPAYRFNCSGRVAEWGACVQPGGNDEEYYIQFQVWRPTGPEGCYELVGYNEPPVDDRQEKTDSRTDSISLSDIVYDTLSPVDHCVVLTVRENEQIDFQPGDVVGYYVDYFEFRDEDESDGGIQWTEDSEVVVHYRDDLPREDIKSQYALNGINPTECGFQISGGLHTLSDSSSSAPIISLTLAVAIPVPLLSSSTPVVASSTPSTTMNPSIFSSCNCYTRASLNTENACGDTTKRNVPIVPAVAILIIIIATITNVIAVSVLLWLRKGKRSDIILESNTAYHTVNVMDANESLAASSVRTSPNTAYQPSSNSDSRESMDIGISANAAYISTTDITTCVNATYHPLNQPI